MNSFLNWLLKDNPKKYQLENRKRFLNWWHGITRDETMNELRLYVIAIISVIFINLILFKIGGLI
tara:strand:+ start:2126 stop:2320 length:195 start_codon:yes stop_codon:yes gene_type:complete